MIGPGLTISGESSALLTVNRFVTRQTTGLFALSGADERPTGVCVEVSGEAAPFYCTVQINGIAQVASDGAGVLDEGDTLSTAASGKVKKRAQAAGATLRHWCGIAQSGAAATDGLLVDVLIHGWPADAT